MSSIEREYLTFACDMRDALVLGAKVVADNFGKSITELKPEYKQSEGSTVRTIIDTYAEDVMKKHMKGKYPQATYNMEEEGVSGVWDELQIGGDPFDGTANAQPKLPLSTQGMYGIDGKEFVAAAALHPFEQYVLHGAKGAGVYRTRLAVDADNNYHLIEGSETRVPSLEAVWNQIKAGKLVVMPYIDAFAWPINFGTERKAMWYTAIAEKLDKGRDGSCISVAPRMMGSNIDACMKLAEGRLHIQLTDGVGGTFDVAPGFVFLRELGGIMTDVHGNPLKAPENLKEMKEPTQQIMVASIHPELHEKVLPITQDCYGLKSQIFYRKAGGLITIPEYRGFKKWDPATKQIFDLFNTRE